MFCTGIFTPFRVCFVDDEDDSADNLAKIDLIFDLLFLVDIIVNFVSAFYDEYGEIVVDFKSIFINYITGWFWIDFVAM